MNKLFTILGISALLFSEMALAANGDATILANREELIKVLNQSVITVGKLIGVILLMLGIYKMKLKADQPTNPQHSPGMIITILVAGALMINFSQSISTFIVSMLYQEGAEYCFILDSEQSHSQGQCWSSENAESTGLLAQRIDALEGQDGASDFKQNIDILMGLFQVIGLIYFFKGAYGLKQVGDGGQRGGYGKPLLTMAAAALVIDLPHTIDMVLNTIEAIGFNIA